MSILRHLFFSLRFVFSASQLPSSSKRYPRLRLIFTRQEATWKDSKSGQVQDTGTGSQWRFARPTPRVLAHSSALAEPALCPLVRVFRSLTELHELSDVFWGRLPSP
ncbi:hypothetical protein GQ607_007046 [Colletotrichum asianum]|uniref:Secreted protein n=1 Tax=Colletotrichum asianum TaxID=702518 RepID=A0A8H3WEQ6_9PEZI|nr:hypothetical protein GQ607_007046 [Colletotrichum asianum]